MVEAWLDCARGGIEKKEDHHNVWVERSAVGQYQDPTERRWRVRSQLEYRNTREHRPLRVHSGTVIDGAFKRPDAEHDLFNTMQCARRPGLLR
jgi:hypothetical protein